MLKEHKAYGHKRIAIHLGVNKKRVLSVMKLFGLSPIRKIKVRVKNKDLKQAESENANLIGNVTIAYPSQIWVKYTHFFNKHYPSNLLKKSIF